MKEPLAQLQEVSEALYEARAPECLARVKVLILSVPSHGGGLFSLLHEGKKETVDVGGDRFMALKFVSHVPLGLFGLHFSQKQPSRESLVACLQEARQLDLGPDCEVILTASLELAQRDRIDRAEFQAYAQGLQAPVARAMEEAARLQLAGMDNLFQRWKERVGPAWDDLVSAVGTGWARVEKSPRFQALARVTRPSNLYRIQGVRSEDELLVRLGRILNQEEMAELFFGDRERLDEDIMGRPVEKLLRERGSPCPGFGWRHGPNPGYSPAGPPSGLPE